MVRIDDILDWFDGPRSHTAVSGRGHVTHVIIIDGTFCSLRPGYESNAGITWHLLHEIRHEVPLSLYYEQGLQWHGWRHSRDVIAGRGINTQIRRAYGFLASRYRPGDRIFLFGYSRGAYAVRSLAGMIDRMGLLRHTEATERAIRLLYRHYQNDPDTPAARRLARRLCYPETVIEMVGVWDTVKAMGIQWPTPWRFAEAPHRFRDHRLGAAVRRGCHALALNETRTVFAPELWDWGPDWQDRVEQVWFRGAHGDIGGQLGEYQEARPLANIPLVWLLGRAERAGLALPAGWPHRFPTDPTAPMIGTWRGWGKMFLSRRRRRLGRNPTETVHPTALAAWPTPVPPPVARL